MLVYFLLLHILQHQLITHLGNFTLIRQQPANVVYHIAVHLTDDFFGKSDVLLIAIFDKLLTPNKIGKQRVGRVILMHLLKLKK